MLVGGEAVKQTSLVGVENILGFIAADDAEKGFFQPVREGCRINTFAADLLV